MKVKLWKVIAVATAVLLAGAAIWALGAVAPVVIAQSKTGTPRAGIMTVATETAVPEVVTAPAISPTAAATVVPNSVARSTATGTITVVGEGRVSIKPDIARVNIGVENVKPTVKEASAQTKTTMDAVLKAVKDQGIADKDIQTSNFSIYTERTGPPDSKGNAGNMQYHVSNQVAITIRDLNQVSNVLDAAIEAGANNIYGVNFSVQEPAKVEAQGRQAAVQDALRRARELARLNGVQLGNVVSVSEVVGSQGGMISNSFRDSVMGKGAGGGGPISPGEMELTMQIQVTYAIQ